MAAIDALWPQLTPAAGPRRPAGLADPAGHRGPRPDREPARPPAPHRDRPGSARPTCRCSTSWPNCSAWTTPRNVTRARTRAASADRVRAGRAGDPHRLRAAGPRGRTRPRDPDGVRPIDADQLAERQDLGDRLTAAERAAADRTWTYGHVIVDEAQELSPMAWRLLMRRSPEPVDDPRRGHRADRRPGRQHVLADGARAVRGPALEADRADRQLPHPGRDHGRGADVLAAIDPTQTAPRSVRESGNVPWAHRVPAASVADEVRRRVAPTPGPGSPW